MPLTQQQYEFFTKLLVERKKQLIKEAAGTIGENIAPLRNTGSDFGDLALNETDRNFLLRIRDRERKLISKIDETLLKIKEGTYGICEECGGDISFERLKARPVASRCIECKTRQEEREEREKRRGR